MFSSIRVFPVLMLTVFSAAQAWGAVLEDTVATVNGQAILLSEFNKELDAAVEHWKKNVPGFLEDKLAVKEIRGKVLDQMVDHALLQQEAEKRKLKIHDRELDNGIAEIKERNFKRDEAGKELGPTEIEAALEKELKREGLTPSAFRERIRKQLMVRKVVDEAVRPNVKPPEEADVKKAFERLKFVIKGDTSTLKGLTEETVQAYVALGGRVKDLTAERVRVSHILVKLGPSPTMVERTQALKKIQDIKKQINAGEDFSEMARKNSDDAESSSRGGDLGFILKGWMPADFEKVAFTTAVGDVSEPIVTQFGYHILRVQEKKAAESLTFDKLKDDLTQFLFNLAFQIELEKTVKTLRAQSHIEIKLPKEKDL